MVYIDSNYPNIDEKRIIDLIELIQNIFNYSNTEVSVLFVNDEQIKELNNKYRNINKSTDVLSFSMLEGDDCGDANMLGDIVISYDTANKQAIEQKHSLLIEIDHLVCHSMLHLIGYDHITNEDKKIMFSKHKELLLKFYRTLNEDNSFDNWFLDD